MDSIIPIIIIGAPLVGSIVIGIIGVILFKRKQKGTKSPEAVLKEIHKRLAQNPRDPVALFSLADSYFKSEYWEKAFNTYKILEELLEANQNAIDAFQVHLNYALSALQLGQKDDAYQGFSAAWTLRQDNLEVVFHLGDLEFQQANYEKAVQYFSLARKLAPDHVPTLRGLGYTFFKLLKHREAVAFLRKAIELHSEDTEALYILGECYAAMGFTDRSLKIFTHLRSDPVKGAEASLQAGRLNANQHKIDQAIEDFEMGLKHTDIHPDILRELNYELALVSLAKHEIGKAVTLLNKIQTETPDYKDVPQLIEQYRELNSNRNLQIFMFASSADFIALCRKITLSYYTKARIKIINITANKSEYIDIIAEVETIKWSDVIIFRFIRSEGSIGEFMVREFHARLKEMKAGKGICLTVGTFSEDARRFTEARLIDLIEKEQLLPIFATVDAKISNTSHFEDLVEAESKPPVLP
jgi:tetratricopeptide (TPR) repeat protein